MIKLIFPKDEKEIDKTIASSIRGDKEVQFRVGRYSEPHNPEIGKPTPEAIKNTTECLVEEILRFCKLLSTNPSELNAKAVLTSLGKSMSYYSLFQWDDKGFGKFKNGEDLFKSIAIRWFRDYLWFWDEINGNKLYQSSQAYAHLVLIENELDSLEDKPLKKRLRSF